MYEQLLFRVGLTGAEDLGQGAKTVLAFAESGTSRDYFGVTCVSPASVPR